MEHSLQVLLVLLVAYGLILEIEKNKVSWWLIAAIILAPLVRYECAAISVAAIFYLLLRGYNKLASISVVLIAVFLGGFSLFLIKLGLGPFPSSILAKSPLVRSNGRIDGLVHALVANVHNSFSNIHGVMILVGIFILSLFLMSTDNTKRKYLSLAAIIAASLHVVAGRYGWFNRYEIYIISFIIIVSLYVFSKHINNYLLNTKKNMGFYFSVTFIVVFGGLIVGSQYIYDLLEIPLASNNIYEQQYQMHRFAVSYYKKPIAVNDIGYTSYLNNNYVLDLWGLGSLEALKYRMNGKDKHWLRDVVKQHNIGLVMIYRKWFTNIPAKWIAIGYLELGKQKITPAGKSVYFYATNHNSYEFIIKKLALFAKTLPSDVKFHYINKSARP